MDHLVVGKTLKQRDCCRVWGEQDKDTMQQVQTTQCQCHLEDTLDGVDKELALQWGLNEAAYTQFWGRVASETARASQTAPLLCSASLAEVSSVNQLKSQQEQGRASILFSIFHSCDFVTVEVNSPGQHVALQTALGQTALERCDMPFTCLAHLRRYYCCWCHSIVTTSITKVETIMTSVNHHCT